MKVISRLLKFIVTGSFSVLLAACYGTMVAMYGSPFYPVRVRVVKATDGDAGIPDLKVTLLQNSQSVMSDTTDESGWADLDWDGMVVGALTILVQDIDGVENGEYRDRVEPLDPAENDTQTVYLEEK